MGKLHSVALNQELCVGCTNCIKGCPTEAIRVRDGKAHIDESRCIDCGECIRICPHHAKSAITDMFPDLKKHDSKHPTVVLIPPSLYAQFGPPATRARIISAMYSIGFDFVYEVALGASASSLRMRELLQQRRKLVEEGKAEYSSVFPVISSACPVAVRLIQMKYKSLISHLVPLYSPMEITAHYAKANVSQKTGIDRKDVITYFLSPCPSKRTATHNPIGQELSDVDYVIAMHEVYPHILSMLEKNGNSKEGVEPSSQIRLADADGVQWATAGGEAATLGTDKYMAVDGIHNVISILDEIENERLKDVEFVEPSCCFGGCIGGPLVASNPFSARARMRSFVKAAIEEKAVSLILLSLPRPSRLRSGSAHYGEHAMQLDSDIITAMDKYQHMEIILKTTWAIAVPAALPRALHWQKISFKAGRWKQTVS